MTNYEKIDYCAAMVCYLRDENFIPKIKKNIKVKDLCHYSRKYRDAVHLECNLQYK